MRARQQLEYNATIVGRENINPELVILRVQPDDELFDFTPGQFAVLGLFGREPRVPRTDTEDPPIAADKLIRRAYSISSSSVEKHYVEVYLNLVPSGELTPRLFNLSHGEPIFLGTKASGVFTLEKVPRDKTAIMIATGTGLAPYVSMMRSVLMERKEQRFVIVEGARHSWELGYRDELATLALNCPNLTYIPSITRPQADPHFPGATGRVQVLIEEGVIERESGVPLDPEQAHVFICGNPGMIDAVKEVLQARGFVPDNGKEPGTIHVEEYW